jgi:hypothetical protein
MISVSDDSFPNRLHNGMFRFLFSRAFQRGLSEMDMDKATVRLKLDKDELDTLTARIYQESGHGLEHDDPILVQYLMHKIMLAQFLEIQGKTMSAFADSLLPHILDTEERFEKNKAEFVKYLENAKEESLQALHDKYSQMVKGTLGEIHRAIINELETVVRNMRSEEGSMSRMMDEERGKLRKTVEQFENAMWQAAYVVGGAFLVSALGIVAWFSWA